MSGHVRLLACGTSQMEEDRASKFRQQRLQMVRGLTDHTCPTGFLPETKGRNKMNQQEQDWWNRLEYENNHLLQKMTRVIHRDPNPEFWNDDFPRWESSAKQERKAMEGQKGAWGVAEEKRAGEKDAETDQ